MVFNSYVFILLFLPVTALLFYAGNKADARVGKLVLILASIIFYMWQQDWMILFLGVSISINYIAVRLIDRFSDRKRLLTTITVLFNIGALLYFKYRGFFISIINNIFNTGFSLKEAAIPLGISFYTFQQIAYVLSFANKRISDCSLWDYLAYILYFPKLTMGPITDPSEFISQLNQDQRKKAKASNIASGLKLFCLGLFKKVVFADVFAKTVSWGYSNVDSLSSVDTALLMLFYTLEIYYDFSGYSDMAVGASCLFNIDLPMNFDSPYKAVSIRDFWKRWHISLTSFFTKYLYIPLGGSRKGKVMTYVNMMLVFLVSGLWHGANWTFVLWGTINGMLACLEREFDEQNNKIPALIRWVLTFGMINILWLLFSAPSVAVWKQLILNMFSFRDLSISNKMLESMTLYGWHILEIIPGIGFLLSNVKGLYKILFLSVALLICLFLENNYRNKEKLDTVSLVISSLCFIWGLLALSNESSFVYFGF